MKIVNHPARVKVLSMGRRWGKTLTAGAVVLAAASRSNAVAWIAPTYKNTRPLWRFAERMCAPLREAGVKIRKTDKEIHFPGQGMLAIYSGDAIGSILGNDFDLVVLDEASRMQEDVWTDYVQPTLADRDGQAFIISTPRGRNWFFREYQRGVADGKLIASFNAPTNANPSANIQLAFERARGTVSERTFKEQWLAQFMDDAGSVFRRIRDCAKAIPQSAPIDNHTYAAGLDWALSNDYTVLTVIDVTTKAVAYTERFNMIDYPLQRQRIATACKRFKVRSLISEANAMGHTNNTELRRDNVPAVDFTTSNKTKAAIIEDLEHAFDLGQILIPDDPVLIGELEAFEQKRTKDGSMQYGAPPGLHDDTVISLALAWSAAKTSGKGLY